MTYTIKVFDKEKKQIGEYKEESFSDFIQKLTKLSIDMSCYRPSFTYNEYECAKGYIIIENETKML